MKEPVIKHPFKFKGFHNISSMINLYHIDVDGIHYVGFEDINEGTSVTNATEIIATEVIKIKGWNTESCLFFEWYEDSLPEDTVDEIIYNWENNKATIARWKPYCPISQNPFKC